MPKSPSASSPLTSNPPKDDAAARMADIAARKKKNADAQAAFRQRRANYIATLEETVTNLESVVLQLQDSCRDARNEAQELRQENARLRFEIREREKYWRAVWPRKSGGHGSEGEDIPPPPPFSHSTGLNGTIGTPHLSPYTSNNMPYRTTDESSMCTTSQYTSTASHAYGQNTSSMPFTGDGSGSGSSHNVNHRVQKYNPYFTTVPSSRDGWPPTISQNSSSGGEADVQASGASHSSHSPSYTESPTYAPADLSFMARYPTEDQKVPLTGMSANNNPYMFSAAGSRSISPVSSTPPSSSSTSLTSPFQFFPDATTSNDRADYDYQRHHQQHEMTLHGGTADLALATAGPGTDAVRYRLGIRRPNSGADRNLLSVLPPLSTGESGSPQERGSNDGDHTSRLRSRSSRASRSPSPSLGPPLSGTLAVIKAQAFGALRRTRARPKKADGASKVAIEVLEARGLGMGIQPAKRPRLDDGEDLHVSHS